MNVLIVRGLGFGISILAFALAGCGGGQGADTPAPAFTQEGQPKGAEIQYPSGPYGIKPGSVITDYHFVGFANAATNNSSLQEIDLHDFYNPSGDETFPDESPYGAGAAKPRALLIDVASVWCPPCNEEAGTTLPGLYKKYQPMGGEFMLQLADGPNYNDPATQLDLFKWTKKYKVDYPGTIDPTYKLGALFQADAFPANMIIDTRTMTICQVLAGAPPVGDPFWKKFEAVMSDPKACTGK